MNQVFTIRQGNLRRIFLIAVILQMLFLQFGFAKKPKFILTTNTYQNGRSDCKV